MLRTSAGAAAVALTLALSGPAWAYPQPSGLTGDQSAVCGARPADYAGTDAQTAWIVELDQRTWDGCARREMLAAQAHADSGLLLAAVNGPVPVAVQNFPAAPTSQTATVTYSAATAGQVDGEMRALHGDLWILCGAIVGCFLMGEALRRIFP